MKRRWMAGTLAAILMLGGCHRAADTPLAPKGQPIAMTSTVCEEGADTPLTTRTVTYTYQTDEAGRVTERRYAIGATQYREQTTYDAAGRAIGVTSDRLEGDVPAAGSTAHRITYDERGRRLIDAVYAREGASETLTARTAYTYGEGERAEHATVTDADGAVLYTVAFTYTTGAAFVPSAPLTDYDYAAAALVECAVTSADDGTVLQIAVCAYNEENNPLYRETEGVYEQYAYDDDGRLLSHVTHRDGMVYRETYTYSADGA